VEGFWFLLDPFCFVLFGKLEGVELPFFCEEAAGAEFWYAHFRVFDEEGGPSRRPEKAFVDGPER